MDNPDQNVGSVAGQVQDSLQTHVCCRIEESLAYMNQTECGYAACGHHSIITMAINIDQVITGSRQITRRDSDKPIKMNRLLIEIVL